MCLSFHYLRLYACVNKRERERKRIYISHNCSYARTHLLKCFGNAGRSVVWLNWPLYTLICWSQSANKVLNSCKPASECLWTFACMADFVYFCIAGMNMYVIEMNMGKEKSNKFHIQSKYIHWDTNRRELPQTGTKEAYTHRENNDVG